MKKIILFCLTTILISASLISLCAKKTLATQRPMYLPHRTVTITKTPQEYLQDFLPDGCVILMFYAEWCNPCKRMCPLIDNLASLLPQFTFLKINRDYFKDLAQTYNVTSIPTLIFLYNGKEIGRYDGKPLTQEELGTLIKKVYSRY